MVITTFPIEIYLCWSFSNHTHRFSGLVVSLNLRLKSLFGCYVIRQNAVETSCRTSCAGWNEKREIFVSVLPNFTIKEFYFVMFSLSLSLLFFLTKRSKCTSNHRTTLSGWNKSASTFWRTPTPASFPSQTSISSTRTNLSAALSVWSSRRSPIVVT